MKNSYYCNVFPSTNGLFYISHPGHRVLVHSGIDSAFVWRASLYYPRYPLITDRTRGKQQIYPYDQSKVYYDLDNFRMERSDEVITVQIRLDQIMLVYLHLLQRGVFCKVYTLNLFFLQNTNKPSLRNKRYLHILNTYRL